MSEHLSGKKIKDKIKQPTNTSEYFFHFLPPQNTPNKTYPSRGFGKPCDQCSTHEAAAFRCGTSSVPLLRLLLLILLCFPNWCCCFPKCGCCCCCFFGFGCSTKSPGGLWLAFLPARKLKMGYHRLHLPKMRCRGQTPHWLPWDAKLVGTGANDITEDLQYLHKICPRRIQSIELQIGINFWKLCCFCSIFQTVCSDFDWII